MEYYMNYGIDEKISKPLLYRKLTNDKVINITGEGGAGKSTLCENFRKNTNEYIVIDFDSINLNNNKVGTLEYDLVKLIVNKYGKDIFPRTHHRNGEKQMLINEEFFEKFGLFKIDDTRRKNTFKRTKSFLQRDASESHRCRQVHHSCGWNKEST